MSKIALLPGGFKPPHAGHYNMAKWLASNTDATTILIKVGAKKRDNITREISETFVNPNPVIVERVKEVEKEKEEIQSNNINLYIGIGAGLLLILILAIFLLRGKK